MALVYFAAGKLGLRLASVHTNATAVWPPTGIALAAAILLGRRAAPGVFLGALLTNLDTPVSAAMALGIAVGNTLEALVGAFLVNRFAGGRRAFEQPRDVFRFVAYGGLVGTMLSATIGVAALCLGGSEPWNGFTAVWTTWWFGDAMGALLFAPILLVWNASPRPRWPARRVAEALVLLASLVVAALLMSGFLLHSRLGNGPFGFVAVPVLLWAAFRFPPREAAAATLVLFSINLLGTLAGRGQFVRSSPNLSLLLLQGFSGFTTVMTLFVSSVVAERDRAEQTLRELNQELEERVAARAADLRKSQEELDRFFNLSLDMLCIASTDGYFKRLSPMFETTLGYSAEELLAKPFLDLVHPDDVTASLAEVEKLSRGVPTIYFENRYRTKAGDYRWFAWTSQPAPDGTLYATARDITDQKQAEQALEHRALHDPLTGCANRPLFFDRLEKAMARSRRAQARGDRSYLVALGCLDLDGFKPVNDRLGHAAGDFVLREVAARLHSKVREIDTVARLGGDEFAVVLGELSDAEDARQLAESLLAAIREPFVWQGCELQIGGSLGIALFPTHSEAPDGLLQRADEMMYLAKREGGDLVRIA